MKRLVNRLSGACLYVLLALIVGMSSCEDDANDWTVNKNYDALFRPLTFDKSATDATSVTLRYSQIVNAKVYIFEFYTDSLEFNAENYVRTDTILKDTLTVFSESNTPMRMEYRTLFQEFNGSTQYSVRMKGEDAQGKASTYVSVAFKTPDEQLFTGVEVTANSATLTWEETNRVTHLTLAQMVDTKYGEEKQIDLTSEDIVACSKTLSELENGATYRVRIYNNDALRGSYVFKTLGLGGSEILFVEATETGVIDLSTLLSNFVKEKECSNVTVQLTPGAVYKVSELKIPGLDNILFTSTEANENNRPQLIVTNKISLASPIQSLSFEFVCLNGNGEASYMTDWKNSSYAQSISFTGCAIQNIKRTLVRISNGSGVFMTDITIDNCVISEVGTDGYGMINFGKNIDQLEKVSITNSTLINIGDQLMDVKGGIGDVILENCTFYNSMDAKKELPKVFRFDNAASTPPSPKSATMRNLIFSGPNKGKKMNSGNGAYDILNFSDNCYITSDLQEGNNRFEEITRIKQSSDDLFVDPLNGDFHIKPGAGFAGTGNAGDPRWY